MIDRIYSTLKILLHKKGGINYLVHKSASIASFNILVGISEFVPDLDCIIDVGANIGQFAIAANKFYPNAIIHSFEPVPSSFVALEKNITNIPNINIYNVALGDISGDISFYQNAHSHASSVLEVSNFQKSSVPKTRKFHAIKVQCYRLDKFLFKNPIQGTSLLKLDVQGFEKNVLIGAQNFLNQIDYIVLETSFISMYKNEPLFDEMHSFLKTLGFVLIAPIGIVPSTNFIFPQLDMLYKKV